MDKIIIAAGILLVAFALWRTVQKLRGKAKNSCCGTAEAVSVKKVSDTDPSHYPYRYRLGIGGMKCSNCARSVENLLNAVPGVWGRVDLGKKEADVLAKSPVAEESFAAAFSGSGYILTGYALAVGGEEN